MSKINRRRIITIFLLPFVIAGLFFIYQKKKVSEISAVDHLSISYNGSGTPDPIFAIDNMLPGDEVEKEINVKNNSEIERSVFVHFIKSQGTKDFSEILDVTITHNLSTLYEAKLDTFFGNPGGFFIFTLLPNEDKDFQINVVFPQSSGNEYQEAKVVFEIKFASIPHIDLPPECSHLQGIVTNVIEGTDGNDNIKGSYLSELIIAYDGKDKVDGRGGHDCILGGAGNDKKLEGGSGNDIIVGGLGNDKIDGGSGSDIIFGNEGNDKIDGGSGSDTIYAGEGNDKIDGGSGSDQVLGGSGDDKIKGGSGNDYLDGGEGVDKLYGNSGLDECLNGETTSSCEL